jgi:hypothetical protein
MKVNQFLLDLDSVCSSLSFSNVYKKYEQLINVEKEMTLILTLLKMDKHSCSDDIYELELQLLFLKQNIDTINKAFDFHYSKVFKFIYTPNIFITLPLN